MRPIMFRSLLAALACSTATAALAQTNVTLYGIADGAIEFNNAGRGTETRVVSGGLSGSRLGLRGTEDLGAGLSAIFRLESGVNLDDGTVAQGGRMWGREASVGLSHGRWGSLSAGRIPTPYWMVQSAVDAFAWGGAGALVALSRSDTATAQLLPLLINGRSDNALNYTFTGLGGLELRALVSARENSTTIGRSHFLSGRYRAGRLDAVAAWGEQSGAGSGTGAARAWVVGGSYDFGWARLFVGYTDERNRCATCTGPLARVAGVMDGGASAFRLANVGVRMPFGRTTVIAQAVRIADRSDYAAPAGNRDANLFALGAEYALSKRTTLYGSLGTVGNRNDSRYALGTGSVQQPPGAVERGDARSKTASLGLRHVF